MIIDTEKTYVVEYSPEGGDFHIQLSIDDMMKQNLESFAQKLNPGYFPILFCESHDEAHEAIKKIEKVIPATHPASPDYVAHECDGARS